MRVQKALLVIAAFFLFGAVSCSDDDSSGISDAQKQDGIDAMEAAGLDSDQANCMIDYMSDNLDSDQIDLITSDTEPPGDSLDDLQAQLDKLQPIIEVMAKGGKECDVPDDFFTGLEG